MSKETKRIVPLTPLGVEERFLDELPDSVIEAINELLVKNYVPDFESISIPKAEIIEKLKANHDMGTYDVIKAGYLKFQKYYERYYWSVSYNLETESFDFCRDLDKD